MRNRSPEDLSRIERDAIAEIRALRRSPRNALHQHLLDDPALLLHHLLVASHGHVQLRIAVVARELAVELRTLERAFMTEFSQTMAECQCQTRLAYAQWMLSVLPPTKISVVAATLGYDRVQDFNRFFKKRTGYSPSEWSRNERAKIARAARRTSSE